MTIFNSTIQSAANSIEKGLTAIADSLAKKPPVYIVNVVVAPGTDTDKIEKKVQETLDRTAAREASIT